MTIPYLKGIQDTPGGRLPVVALAANVALHRLYRYPGGDWNVAPPDRRTGRVDPPRASRRALSTGSSATPRTRILFFCGKLDLLPASIRSH